MKLNLDFYKGEDLYSYEEIENETTKYIEENEECDYEDVFKNDMRWTVFYHLTPIRQNILNWYEFKPDSDILEIGAELGSITGVLCDKAKNVTAVEISKRRAESIKKRHKTKENLEIIVGNLNDIKFDKKFDYITIIGALEHASMYISGNNPFENLLIHAKDLLKKDGKLLIATENKFGMKYFAGAKEEHTGIIYDSITGYNTNKDVQTFGKGELENILNSVGLKNQKFYYPLPDFKLPNTIFSDSYLPNIHNISAYIPYYCEKCNVNFSEIQAYKEVIKNNNFQFFSNSFFIECSESKLEDSASFINFSNYRKAKYRMVTCINKNKLIKNNINSKSEEHFKQYTKNIDELKEKQFNCIEKYTDNSIESDYIQDFKSLKEILYEKYSNNHKDEFYDMINQYKELLLKDKSDIEKNNTIFDRYNVSVDKNTLNEFNFIESGFWDLIFQNCFVKEGEYYFFDQEWKDEMVPVEFILYRCFLGYAGMIKSIELEEILSNLGIMKYNDLFGKLEVEIQKSIRDDKMYDFYTCEHMSLSDQKEMEKQNLESTISDYENKLQDILNSRSWKLTKPLRNISKIFRKNENNDKYNK